MKNSGERISFIADYLSNYKSKIEVLNSCGLFDAAVHFELFAQEVSSIWFENLTFKNLNIFTYTYPCVDLVSSDNSIHVQVSTTASTPAKIKKTVSLLESSKDPKLSNVGRIVFFFLHSTNSKKIKKITNSKIQFDPATDVITIKSILERAKADLDFQNALYSLLQKDYTLKTTFDIFTDVVNKSKFDISEIPHLINDEYEIDRTEFINKIKDSKHNNIAILGHPGSGKTVICRSIVKGYKNVLFARSERFIEAQNINEIWGVNLIDIFKNVSQEVFIFIDSLEFIADNFTKNNLLPYFFKVCEEFENIKIIISCRTSDYNAFIKLTNKYSIEVFEVNDISDKELLNISQKYPIIKKLKEDTNYCQLLKTPLYIDLIVSKITDFSNIKNENDFRNYVWDNIICQKNSDNSRIIKKIAFERAKKFLLYVSVSDFDSKIIKKLISDGVLIENNSNVRLKYDIFEDICFEKYFDEIFSECRGNYNYFFTEISQFGRCVYRRYQIWISNKVLNKNDRNTIIRNLIISNTVPSEWQKETIIGLVRSRFSKEFFIENADSIIDNNLLDSIIDVINLYGYSINNSFIAKYSPSILLVPSGSGRPSLLGIVYKNNVYKNHDYIQTNILKMINDYCNNRIEMTSETTQSVINILKYYLEKSIAFIETSKEETPYDYHEYTIKLLEPLYWLCEHSKDLILSFWQNLEVWYKGNHERYAKEILEFTFNWRNSILALHLPSEMCTLSHMFWTYQKPVDEFDIHKHYRNNITEEIEYDYGLNDNAKHYQHYNYNSSPTTSNFFHTLFYRNFWKGLKWAVAFINEAILHYKERFPNNIFDIEIHFLEDRETKKYMGNGEMWIASIEENQLPTLLSDLLYCLQEEIIETIENKRVKNGDIISFANNVKQYLVDYSNNIALLSIISTVGIKFQKELPGYAVDLATSMDLTYLDQQKMVRMMPNPQIEALEKQMMIAVGLPDLKRRYLKKRELVDDLQTYIFKTQIYGNKENKEKCFLLLDYLYSLFPNDKENANKHLQIQKMDARKVETFTIDDKTIAIQPVITGEAEKIVKDNLKENEKQSKAISLINELYKKDFKNVEIDISEHINVIEYILENRDFFQYPSVLDEHLLLIISLLLLKANLDFEERDKYCQVLVEAVNGYIHNNGNPKGYHFHPNYCLPLYSQLKFNVSKAQKDKIKKIMLDSLLYDRNSGLVDKVAQQTRLYLQANQDTAIVVFNTIIKLAEDEMKHQVFNANYIKQKQDDKFEFRPNITSKLRGVDNLIDEAISNGEDVQKYNSKKNMIINDYLFDERELKIRNYNPENYDIVFVSYALNCGISLSHNIVTEVMNQSIKTMLDIWNSRGNASYDILDVYTLNQIESFLGENLIGDEESSKIIIKAMLSNVDFQKFKERTIEFYHNVFFRIVPSYFDAYNDGSTRKKLMKMLQQLEDAISNINIEYVKTNLFKSLVFFFPRYKSSDWSKCKTKYSLDDKDYLNNQFIKYGSIDLGGFLNTIVQFHAKELMPEILKSIYSVFDESSKKNETNFEKTIIDNKNIINLIISVAFLQFSDSIKKNEYLTEYFEGLLNILCDYHFETAAVILDEFRIH